MSRLPLVRRPTGQFGGVDTANGRKHIGSDHAEVAGLSYGVVAGDDPEFAVEVARVALDGVDSYTRSNDNIIRGMAAATSRQ